MKKRISAIILLLIMSLSVLPVFASGVQSGIAGETNAETTQAAESTTTAKSEGNKEGNVSQAVDPEYLLGIKGGDYSVEHIGNKLQEKGMDIVYLVKIVGRYICIVAFVVCVIFLVIGIIGNPKILLKSAIGAVIAGIAYAAITCGEDIVMLIASWAAS